jgi:hypothetical protein
MLAAALVALIILAAYVISAVVKISKGQRRGN